MCLQKEDVEADTRVDADLADLASVDAATHSESLQDTAPVLEGIKVLTQTDRFTYYNTQAFNPQSL